MTGITYKDAGVDIEKADGVLSRIKDRIHGTFNPYVLNPIGGFAAVTEVPGNYRNPVLVSSTDGVGTKLKIAFTADKHDTVGIDLVAMGVNDILTIGAKPFFFLDYFATGRIEERIYESVITGICEGCKIAGCALIGGETAEMPSFYGDGEYDLAGFVIGFVEKDGVVDGSKIHEGDVIIGLASNGLHSNGFSLVRKVLFDVHNLGLEDEIECLNGRLGQELLRPTRIYVRNVLDLLKEFEVKGMAHITGGGLPGNIRRIIPDGLAAHIELVDEKIPPIFKLIQRLGKVPVEDMYSTFNMGIGYVLVVDGDAEKAVIAQAEGMGEKAFRIGEIQKSPDNQKVYIEQN